MTHLAEIKKKHKLEELRLKSLRDETRYEGDFNRAENKVMKEWGETYPIEVLHTRKAGLSINDMWILENAQYYAKEKLGLTRYGFPTINKSTKSINKLPKFHKPKKVKMGKVHHAKSGVGITRRRDR